MNRVLILAALVFGLALPAGAQKRGLDIYFVDTEGGAATLIVTPAGESVLIDSGNPGDRDAGRIHHAAQVAGLKAIDNIVCTHWHLDHYGGHGPLAKLMPIRRFWDRGHPGESNDDPDNFPKLYAAYKAACGGKTNTLRAGDVVALKQAGGAPRVELKCIMASGEPIPDRPGAPKNTLASEFQAKDPDPSDNAKSLGFVLQLGGWRLLDLGDLTWNMEEKLVEPTNKIGLIDVYQTTHHGLEISNNPVLIKSVQPRVAIFNNGPHKGGHPDVTRTLRSVQSVQGIWQVHKNLNSTDEMNTKPSMIANMDEKCKGEFIHLSVAPDGKSYTVQIGEHGKPVRYQTRSAK